MGTCGSPPMQEPPRPVFPRVSRKGGHWEMFPMEPPSPRGMGNVRGNPPTLGTCPHGTLKKGMEY